LEGREEVEERDGDKDAVVGHNEPRRKRLTVPDTCAQKRTRLQTVPLASHLHRTRNVGCVNV